MTIEMTCLQIGDRIRFEMKVQRTAWVFVGLLFLGFALRMFEIGEPLIDKQAWRQTDTAAVARNFFEEDFNIFSPRVDWRGDGPGVVEMNFPLYPYLVSLLYGTLGGVYEWVGRLLSSFFSVATSILLFFLARKLGFSASVGLWAMFFFHGYSFKLVFWACLFARIINAVVKCFQPVDVQMLDRIRTNNFVCLCHFISLTLLSS